MTEPNPEFLDGETPTISLGNKSWPVPMLAPKQNRVIVPAVLRIAPRILRAVRVDGPADLEAVAEALNEETYEDLLRVVYVALTRAHKGLTREEFDDLPMDTHELMIAFFVVAKQTGLLKAKEDAGSGE